METLTAHRRPVIFLVTVFITRRLSSHPVSIKSILPFPHLPDFLITVFVLIIAVWSCWIVNVVPVLHSNLLFLWLSLPLPSTSLPLLPSIEAIHIVILYASPVCQSSFSWWSSCARSDSSLLLSCALQGSGFWEVGFWFWLLRQLGSFGRLEPQSSYTNRLAWLSNHSYILIVYTGIYLGFLSSFIC